MNSSRLYRSLMMLPVFLACLITADNSYAQVTAPVLKVVQPRHNATKTMFVDWDPVAMAQEYQIRRREDGLFASWSGWTTANLSTDFSDVATFNGSNDYSYQVRVRVGGVWSPPSNIKTNNFGIFWPVANTPGVFAGSCPGEAREVLNGFNQPIMAGGSNYLHEGMDLNGELNYTAECVRVPYGGIVTSFGGMGSGINVNIQVVLNGVTRMIQFNHLDNLSTSLVMGESIKAGEQVGVIHSGTWTQQNSHTHCHNFGTFANFWPSTQDPHLLWTAAQYRDPQNVAPQVRNTNGDADSLRFQVGPHSTTYFPKDTVYTAVDIVVEAYDRQSTDAPWAAPASVGYYIQKHNGTSWVNSVQSSGSPYLLYNSATGYFNSNSSTANPAINTALSDRQAGMASAAPATPAHYAWSQWWTWRVTNSNSTTGAAANLNQMECWATDARNTVGTANGYTTGYAKARSIDEAKFEDGKYRVNIRVTDHVNTAPDFRRVAVVDNFRPYVKRVRIDAGQLNYDASWSWNAGAGNLQFSPNTDMDKACGEVKIKITTSEFMKSVNINLPTLGYSASTTGPANPNGKEWEFTVPASVIEGAPNSGPHRIEIGGKDLTNNEIQGFPGTGAFAGASIPKRQPNGSWMPNTAAFKDTIHKFETDSASIKISFTTQNVSCPDDDDGKITVTATDGTAPYMYRINGGAYQSSNVFDNLEGGTYTVKVKDANNCTFEKDTVIEEADELEVDINGGSPVTLVCGEEDETTLFASASGGTPGYNFSWPGGSLTVSSSGFYSVTVTDDEGCTASATTFVWFIPIICSRDPNDMIGPEGYDPGNWVSINDVLPYTVRFENDPELATAAAQVVDIRHPLDNTVNPFSFRLSDFGFGSFVFQVPPNSTFYSQRLDVVDSLGVFVDVVAGIDVTKNEAFWVFSSIDPVTGLAPSNATLGFLPVNDTAIGNGEGFVSFTIKPKNTSQTGDSINATSDIVFDDNEIIPTPPIYNVIDALPPTSTLDSLPSVNNGTSIPLSWSGADDPGGSGVRDYEIYASANGGAYGLVLDGIVGTAATFTGVPGFSYDFYVLATDNTGNKETAKLAGEATTTISISDSIAVSAPTGGETYCKGDTVTVTWQTYGAVALVEIILDNDGTQQVLATDVNAAIGSYSFAIPNGQTASNDYSFIVSDTSGTIAAQSGAFSIYDNPTVSTTTTPSNCGLDNGTATAAGSGGTGPYQYSWDANTGNQTTAIATGLGEGVYDVTITDMNGCTAFASATVGALDTLSATTSGSDVSCFGSCDGSASVSATGGDGTYSYIWNDAAAQTTATALGLCAGTYSVTVTDGLGCAITTSYTVGSPTLINLSVSTTDESAQGAADGTASASVSDGTPPYSYAWNTGDTAASISGLFSGSYTVSVTDANGCVAIASGTVNTVPLSDSIAVINPADGEVFCEGTDIIITWLSFGVDAVNIVLSDTGSSIVIANNIDASLGTYSYSIPLGTSATEYSVTIDDTASGGVSGMSGMFSISSNPDLVLSSNPASCNAVNGSATVSATSGAAPFSYLWDANTGSQTTETATGLGLGTYDVTVTSADGCTATGSIAVNELSAVSISATGTDVTCNGGSDGTASASASGGTPPYHYNWSTGDTSANISGLSAGSYSVTATDATGCASIASLTLDEPAPIATTINLASCNPADTGTVVQSLTNQFGCDSIVTAITVLLPSSTDTINLQSCNPADTGVAAVTYTNQFGCDSLIVTVTSLLQSPILSINAIDVACAGDSTGSVDLTVNNGAPPYTFSWSNGATTEDLTNIPAGAYSVSVTGANGCSTSTITTVSEPIALVLGASSTSVSCSSFCDGTATASAGGGTPPYAYSWSNGATMSSITGLCAGSYTVDVTDANGCTATTTLTVSEPPSLTVSVNTTGESAPGANDGSATATPSGGTPPYSYAWSTGANTSMITGLSPGPYSVTVLDANGCDAAGSGVVDSIPAACPVVTGLAHPIVTETAARVSWDGGVPGTFGYLIRGKLLTSQNWAYLLVSDPNKSFFDVFNLMPNTAYEWQIQRFCNATGTIFSAWSARDTVVTRCVAPDTLWVTNITDTSATGHWNAVPGAQKYQVYGYLNASASYTWYFVNTNTITIDDLSPASTYIWRVRSICDTIDSTTSGLSRVDTFVTNGTIPKMPSSYIREVDDQILVSVYPNPNDGRFVIELFNLREETTELSIYNILGGEVYSEKVTPNELSRDARLKVRLNDTGAYFIEVKTPDKTVTKKVIVQQ